ncbi:hypothetical protein DAEQUDRAFT_726137 [Daedalea quercina L-15889]|uniref:Secreted protein n=1 Tax=Daedalea quercina L-15889 TaxID=1314783 RepID=A0A165QR94_9APHY|nr:hypothetical protein DAEQUDRAFT_726137 [Daedalea quercina L-15889]
MRIRTHVCHLSLRILFSGCSQAPACLWHQSMNRDVESAAREADQNRTPSETDKQPEQRSSIGRRSVGCFRDRVRNVKHQSVMDSTCAPRDT